MNTLPLPTQDAEGYILRRYCFAMAWLLLGSLPAWAQRAPARPLTPPPSPLSQSQIKPSAVMIPYRCDALGEKNAVTFTAAYMFRSNGPNYAMVVYGGQVLEFKEAQPLNDMAYVFLNPDNGYQWMAGYKDAQLVRVPKGNELRGPVVMSCTASTVTTLLQPSTYAK